MVIIIGLNEVCNVFAECLSTSFLLFVVTKWGGYLAVPINFLLILMIAEITPKTFAQAYPVGVAKLTFRPLAALTAILHPVARLLIPFRRRHRRSRFLKPSSRHCFRPAKIRVRSRRPNASLSIRCSTWVDGA